MISCTASIESTGTTRPAPAVVLQRKCACGETQGFGGGRKPLCGHAVQGRPSRQAGESAAIPPAVRAVLHSAGRPLDPSARALLEPGFGHDFSTVRVHADAAAADSAAAIGALAYTVGAHVFFAGGQYAPHTRGGRHLLAHELAHVVQQGGDTGNVMRKSASDLLLGDEDTAAEREADGAADRIMRGEKASVGLSARDTLQRAPASHTPAVVGLDPSGPGADLGGKTEDALWECMKGAAPLPQDCPQAPLTWGDYPVVRGTGGFGANTGWIVKDKPMDPKAATCLQTVLGWSQDQTHVFQATFTRRGAFVQQRFANPTDVSATGCDKPTRACRSNFTRRLPANQTAGDFTFSAASGGRCPASIAPARVVVSAAADCHLVEEECTRTAQAESARLLRHEQGHMDIACAMARNFNMALSRGTPFAVLNSGPVAFIQRIQDRYDAETRHGCLPGPQAAWEKEIASGLPREPLPRARPASRPRRRRP